MIPHILELVQNDIRTATETPHASLVHGELQAEIESPRLAVAARPAHVHDVLVTQLAVAPVSPASAASFVERVKAAVREECSKEPRVLCAAVSPDGMDFQLLGDDPTPEMYEVGTDIQDRVIRAVSSGGEETYIEGGWTRARYPRAGWLVVR